MKPYTAKHSTSSSQSLMVSVHLHLRWLQVGEFLDAHLVFYKSHAWFVDRTYCVLYCTVPNYWKAVRCVGGGHVTPLFEQRVPLFDLPCKKSIDFVNAPLAGAARNDRQPQPVCVGNLVTRNCSILFKRLLWHKGKSESDTRSLHLTTFGVDFIGSRVSSFVEGLKGQRSQL